MAGTTTNNAWPYPTGTDLVGQGDVAIKSLADAVDASVGTGLGAWTSWAPTLSGGWLNGNGTWAAYYSKIGRVVQVQAAFTIGSTTTKGTGLTVSLPFTAARAALQPFIAQGNSASAVLLGYIASTTTATLVAQNVAGTYPTRTNVTATVPYTWATGDTIYFTFTYEAAS